MNTDLRSHIGDKYPGGHEIKGEIVRLQGDDKAICLQRAWFHGVKRFEYRFAYYVVARKGKVRGKWVFANRPVFIPPAILDEIFAEARENNWEGFLDLSRQPQV